MVTQLLINTTLSAFLYLLLANSFTITYYPSKFFNFSHAAIITIGAYSFYTFTHLLNIPAVFSFFISILLSGILGFLIELYLFKYLRKKNISPMLFLIASLGLYIILQNCISILWGDETKSLRNGVVKAGNKIFDAYITDIQILTITISIFLFFAIVIFLKYSKIGKNIRAVASNIELAVIQGINPDRVFSWSFFIGSALAAVAGILVASDTGLTPSMGFNLMLYGVIVMIIGGIDSTWGLIGSAFLLAAAQQLTTFYVGIKWMDAITYAILILFLIWKPLGFSGKQLKKTEI